MHPVMQNDRPILTITGSDPAGVTGVQADIKTISMLGGYAVSAVTSVTVQNTLGIQEFYDLPPQVVQGQIEAIVNDVEPQTVKIGMIRTVGVLDVVIDLLNKYRPRHVVYAPVVHSAQGDALMPPDVEQHIRSRLLPCCTVVVPANTFTTHGDTNTFASAVAFYLNEGAATDEALRQAHQLLQTQIARSAGLRGRSSELYQLFLEQVRRHCRTNSDVRYYADLLNVGSGYLAQVTRRIGGQSPKAIIDAAILAEAERLLLTTERTVQEIAYALGFNSQAHFAKFFRKLKGTTPSSFRSRS